MSGVDFSRVCKYMVYAQWLPIKPWQYSSDNVQGDKAQEAKIIIRVSYVLTAAILQSIKSQNFEMGEKLLRDLIHYSQVIAQLVEQAARNLCSSDGQNFLRRGNLLTARPSFGAAPWVTLISVLIFRLPSCS